MSTAMVSRNSRRLRQGSADIISNLPLELILQILKHLPLRDAVRTSVLSKSWRRRWVSILRVILDEGFLMAFLKGRNRTFGLMLDYMIVINGILLSHVGPISKFFLYIPFLFPKETAISPWLRHICTDSIEDLSVLNAHALKTNLPTCLFSCVGLTRLTLLECKLPGIPATFLGFPSLVLLNVLHCAPAAYNSSMLEILISRCPKLKCLNLSAIERFQSDLTIRGPELENLSLMGELLNLCLESTSGIKRCSMDVECKKWYHSACLTDYFSCLANVEALFLGKLFWKVLHHDFIPPIEFSKNLEELKHLYLGSVPLNCSSIMSFILCLLETGPNLEQLNINVADHQDSTVVHLPQFDSLCSLQRLKSVHFSSSIYKNYELQLIKFLLARAPALEVMTIVLFMTTEGAEEKFNLANELLQYGRASPKAHIVLKTVPLSQRRVCPGFIFDYMSIPWIKHKHDEFHSVV